MIKVDNDDWLMKQMTKLEQIEKENKELKELNEALQETSILNGNLVVKYENTMRLIQRNYPVENVDLIPITVLFEIQRIIKDSLA
jgi:hypothetical protein